MISRDINQTQTKLSEMERAQPELTELDQTQPDSKELELAQMVSKDINQTQTKLNDLEQAHPDSIDNPTGSENRPELGSRCLTCLSKFIPVPVQAPITNVNNGLNPNNLVTATQLLADGRTALYNSQGQIIGYLPAGSTVTNNG